MTQLIEIEEIKSLSPSEAADRSLELCRGLERGDILFFPKIPFSFLEEDVAFLLKQKQSGKKGRKNVAFKPLLDKISNHAGACHEEKKRLHEIMRGFCHEVNLILSKLLTPYAAKWKIDYASFRPFQEKGRNLRLTARNDLLHFDAFASRPMHGDRILRFFVNINPTLCRKWITASSFEETFQNFLKNREISLPKAAYHFSVKWRERCKGLARHLGLPVTLRSPYDTFMLRFHHFLKKNQRFQEKVEKKHWEFPPFSCWAVFTDQVSHAALEGQYALEQTFLVPREVLLNPEKAPISVLERLSKEVMTSNYALSRREVS